MIDVILPIRVRLESLTYGFEIVSKLWFAENVGNVAAGLMMSDTTKLVRLHRAVCLGRLVWRFAFAMIGNR